MTHHTRTWTRPPAVGWRVVYDAVAGRWWLSYRSPGQLIEDRRRFSTRELAQLEADRRNGASKPRWGNQWDGSSDSRAEEF